MCSITTRVLILHSYWIFFPYLKIYTWIQHVFSCTSRYINTLKFRVWMKILTNKNVVKWIRKSNYDCFEMYFPMIMVLRTIFRQLKSNQNTCLVEPTTSCRTNNNNKKLKNRTKQDNNNISITLSTFLTHKKGPVYEFVLDGHSFFLLFQIFF